MEPRNLETLEATLLLVGRQAHAEVEARGWRDAASAERAILGARLPRVTAAG